METVKITTSQNVEIDYAVASIGERFAARLIDYMLFFAATMIASFITIGVMSTGTGMSRTNQIILGVIWLVLFVFYDLVAEIFFNGQSIGKYWVKIRVISLNGGRPTMGQYVLRWLFRILDFLISLGSLAVVSVAFSDKRQRVGDIAADTTVVKTTPVKPHEGLFFNTPDEDYQPTYPEVALLTDKDIHLVYDVIRNFNYTRNSNLVYKLALRIRDYLNVSYPKDINEYQFLEIIVNDYTALATNREL